MELTEGQTVLYQGDPVTLVGPYPNTADADAGRWVVDEHIPTGYPAPHDKTLRVIWVEDMRHPETKAHIGHPGNVYYWPEAAYTR